MFSLESFKKWILGNSSVLMYVGFAILFTCVVGAYLYFYSNNKKVTFAENGERGGDGDGADGNPTVQIYFFFTNWCPVCKPAVPEWDSFRSEYENKKVNGYNISFIDVDCSNESPDTTELMNTYGVEGYPTVKMVHKGQIIDFDATCTKDNLVQFVNTVI
jgi:thiol-disulfide isomerase/thioredoxin